MVKSLAATRVAPPSGSKNSKPSRTVTFNRSLGSNAPDLIANLVVSGTIPAIEELIANAYDADATRVDVEYRPEFDALAIKDNGTGMTGRDGLEAFYRLGDSPKVKEPISPLGRTRIGKFGVATILLRSLCEQYKLTTERDSTKTFVYEKLEDRVQSDKPINGREITTKSSRHGTQLLLSRLKFREEDHFAVDELKKRIQWDLPLLPDFQVYVNGEKVQSKSIETATVFKIDKTGNHMGEVKGNLYLTTRKASMPGIHVYVNGRKIGDPMTFFKRERIVSADKLVGVIHADGLEEAILFDRGRFREDHPGVIELGKMIEKGIRAVEQYGRVSDSRSMKSKVENRRDKILEKTHSQLVRGKIGAIDRSTTVEFTDELDPEIPGRFYADVNTLYLNNRHPSLVIDGTTTIPRYEQAVLSAVVDALALAETESAKDSLTRFLKRRGDLWTQLRSTSETEEPPAEMHPMIMYQLSDLARLSGRSLGDMRYLAEGEAFPVGEEGVLGRDFAAAQKLLHGYQTLYSIVHEKLNAKLNGSADHVTNLAPTLDRFHNVLGLASDKAIPFAYRVGNGEARPCFAIEGTCAERVYTVLRSPALDARKSDFDPKRTFTEMYNEPYTMPELARATQTKIDDVTKIIGFAKQNGLNIAVSRATPVRFRFGDYLRVMQVRRKEDYERGTKASD